MNDEKEKNKKMFKKIPGCDLGTTNSAVAVFSSNNQVEVIANERGGRTTPSLIYFSPDGQIIVGDNARKYMETQPERVVYEIKRLIGRRYDDPNVQEFMKKCSYKIVCGASGEALAKIDQKEYSPVQLSAFILKEMKKIYQNYFPEQSVCEMVVTVPAHFNDAQRQATKDAGTVAGLKIERMINEPTAAAMAYGLDKNEGKELIAVFDLGGGTFDISIIEIENGVFSVKSTNGDTWLGGADFDAKLVQWLITKAKEKLNVDLSKDNLALQRFKNEAVVIKHHLSQAESYDINLVFITFDEKTKDPLNLQLKILRREFEDICDDLLQKMIKPCRQCLEDAKVDKVDKVLLVGGMTRMPAVQKIAKEIFKMEPNKSVNPDEAVAIGAAVQGSVLTGESRDILLIDVNPLSLGIETQNETNTIMIKKNSAIPISEKRIFTTANDNQDRVTIRVIEGEGLMTYSSGNRILNTFDLIGIRPALRGMPKIEVEFSINSNGILSVKAKDQDTGKEQQVEVSGLTKNKEDIQRMIDEAREREEEDKKAWDNADLLNRVDLACYGAKKSLEKFAKHGLENEPQYKQLEELFNNLKQTSDSKNYDNLKKIFKDENGETTIFNLTRELEAKITPESKEDKNEPSKDEPVKPEEPTEEEN